MSSSDRFDSLVAQLSDKEFSRFQQAVVELAAIGSATAVDALIISMEPKTWIDRDWSKRRRFIQKQLVQLGQRVVPALGKALKNKKPDIAIGAAEVIGQLQAQQATGALVENLTRVSGRVRLAMANALAVMGWQPTGQLEPTFYVAMQNWTRCLEMGPAAVPALLTVLDIRDGTYLDIINTLKGINDPHTILPILASVKYVTTENTLSSVASAVAKLARNTVAPLEAHFRAQSIAGQFVILEAFKHMPREVAITGLTPVLFDESSPFTARRKAAIELQKVNWQPQSGKERLFFHGLLWHWKQCLTEPEAFIKILPQLTIPFTVAHQLRRQLKESLGASHPALDKIHMPEKVKILVAEDEPDIRDLIAFTLQFNGYEVITAVDGVDAVFKAVVELPDMISMDVRMPRMTGYEATRIIKQREETRHILVVYLSAKGQESEISAGLETGGEDYILKPFAPDVLVQTIQKILISAKYGGIE